MEQKAPRLFFVFYCAYRELVGEASTGGSRVRGAWRCGSAAAAPVFEESRSIWRRPTFTAEQKRLRGVREASASLG